MKCPLGAYAGNEGQSSCDDCPAGKHCPALGMNEPSFCVSGYICNTTLLGLQSNGSLSQLEPCPAGFVCNLNAAPLLCPNGKWCPEGTGTPISFAGNFDKSQNYNLRSAR